MNCNVAIIWMHEYLDGDLPREDAEELKGHLQSCADCCSRFEQLERTEALTHQLMDAKSPLEPEQSAALTARIMNGLPPQRRRAGWMRWIRNHPAVTVAAVFVLVMFTSFTAMWQQDRELTVRGTDLAEVVINGDTVTVPEGARINGDLTIENGEAKVLGDVEGNVTVIEGSLYQASTAHISGQVKTIDQALDWFWYKVTTTFSKLSY
ncbi:zf-HC2 domain-containing protein [Paenibacillus humicola]|uniref:zf-HC2 domain-containing protein n=1 Tax=Paenibacillus humicola TaxID=3110540 RepID=UPI00237AE426|nr:zf-HC2 domain-containing protein [Paenibacillus humicola]